MHRGKYMHPTQIQHTSSVRACMSRALAASCLLLISTTARRSFCTFSRFKRAAIRDFFASNNSPFTAAEAAEAAARAAVWAVATAVEGEASAEEAAVATAVGEEAPAEEAVAVAVSQAVKPPESESESSDVHAINRISSSLRLRALPYPSAIQRAMGLFPVW